MKKYEGNVKKYKGKRRNMKENEGIKFRNMLPYIPVHEPWDRKFLPQRKDMKYVNSELSS